MEKQSNSLAETRNEKTTQKGAMEEAHWPPNYPEDIKEMIRAAMKELELRGLM